MKKINIAIFECTPFSANKGVAALAFSALALIDEIARKKFDNYSLFIVNDNIEKYENEIIVNDRIIKFFCIKPIAWGSLKDIARLCLFSFIPHSYYRYYKYFTFDYVFNAGSGDSFADIYGKKRFNRINNNIKLCSILSKRQMLLPQTIGPFKNNNIREKAINSINKCEFVLARDKQSFEYLQELHIPKSKCSEIIDMAFYMPYIPSKINNGIVNVGINVSGLLWQGGYTKNNQFGLHVNYQELIYKLIDYFSSKDKLCVHLVGHTISKNINASENDYTTCIEIANKINKNNVIVAPFFETPIDAKNYICSLDFFMGARMHATIGAFSSNTPVVPMSYSRKFEGLFKDTLNFKYIVDMKKMSTECALEYVIHCYEIREEIRNDILKINSTIVRDRKEILVDYLQNFMK